ncbi:MAG: hypothetical protein MUF03_04850 [Rubrivivax sp.]|jgi:tRNA(Arg) A34 adenosine deaminase TadA|nr:hypothetical protein [Rubrivivax sp.]
MATIGEFFTGRGRKAYVAAQQNRSNGNLYYYESDDLEPLPPSVYVWAHTRANGIGVYREIMTNFPETWVNTYSPWEHDYSRWSRSTYEKAIPVRALDARPWRSFDFAGLGAPPALTGLYEDQSTYGVSRARRVYMLAAFSKMKKYGRVGHARSEGHNIASVLVDDSGSVLSWGMNTGGFCHAEVNTILGYLARNPAQSTLPAKSVLFTTLKPCLMCSKLILAAQHRGSQVRAWFGMTDEGERGGTPLLGDRAAPFADRSKVDLDFDFEIMADRGMTTEAAVLLTGTQRVNVGPRGAKVDLTKELDASGGGHRRRHMSAADWMDKSDEVWKLVEAAVVKLQGKADKGGRDDGPMKAVLAYLKGWAL